MSEIRPEGTAENSQEHTQKHPELSTQLEQMRAAQRADADERQRQRLQDLEEKSGEHGVVKPENRYGQ